MVALVWALDGATQSASYGPTGADETLWSAAGRINEQYHLGSQAQVALAVFRANPQAFGGSPGRMRPGVLLAVPTAAEARAVSRKQAFDIIIGGAPLDSAPVAAATANRAVAPKAPAFTAAAGQATRPPAPQSPRDPAAVPPQPLVPVVTGVEVLTLPDARGMQTIAVLGSGFREGATLTFRHPVRRSLLAGRKPTAVTRTRIEFTGRLGARDGWRVAVANPDEPAGEAFEFSAAALGGGMPVGDVAAVPPPEATEPAAATIAFAQAPEQAQAAALVRDGQRADEVYKFLLPLEDRFAGDVDYDYALGVAALDSGRLSDAVFVLQRAVANRPTFAGARMELARAYYALGDNESARREFTTLQGEEPPEEAARVIAQYLDAIDRKAESYATRYSAYVDLGVGYDSNANGGPDIQQFLGLNLDARNQAAESNYYSAGLGGGVSYPFAPHLRALGQAGGTYRANPDVPFVDSQTLRAAGGLEWSPAPFVFSLMPGYTRIGIDGQDNSAITAADASASVAVAGAQLGVSGRRGQTRYTDALSQQDVETTIYGASVSAPLSDWPVMVGAAATQGRDEPVQEGSQYGRDLRGLRAFAMAQFGAHQLMLSAATLSADYDKPFFVPDPRSDDQQGLSLAWQWTAFQPLGWLVGGAVNYVDNASNEPLYDYTRVDAGLSLRREFK